MENDVLKEVYLWVIIIQVDSFDLSRPKKNITRDFSDGQLIAEIIYHYLPKIVNLHSFVKANSMPNKVKNWKVLESKVFPKMAFAADKQDIQDVIDCKKMAVEKFLTKLRSKLENTEQIDLFATQNQPLKEKTMKTLGKKTKTLRPKMGSFADLEDEDADLDPKQKELKEVLRLRDHIEVLEDKMLDLRKRLRHKNEQFQILDAKLRRAQASA